MRDVTSIGAWFAIDTSNNTIAYTHVNVEELARELGVLQAWEAVTKEAS